MAGRRSKKKAAKAPPVEPQPPAPVPEVLPPPPKKTSDDDRLEVLVGLLAGDLEESPEVYEQARDAVERVFHQHENQLRVFLVGAAKSKLRRVLRSMEIIDQIEAELFDVHRISPTTKTEDLVRMYAYATSNQHSDFDFIRKVADMNLEIQRVMGAVGYKSTFDNKIQEVVDKLPTPNQRALVRKAVEDCLAALKRESAKDE